MSRWNPTFVMSVLVCLCWNLNAVLVQSQTPAPAPCAAKRCVPIGLNDNLKYTTCGAKCTIETCTDIINGCTPWNATSECEVDWACVSEPYLQSRAIRENLAKTYSDPCCVKEPEEEDLVFCFSAMATANVVGKGNTRMSDLQVGDHVLTASGTYQPVYMMDHQLSNKAAEFLQIYTTTSTLEITKHHFVFLHGKADPVPAGQLKVGDVLQRLSNEQPAIVTNISTVIRKGLWNPLTQDGTLLVDGIVTSTYTALHIMNHNKQQQQLNAYLQLGGYHLLSKHDFIHLLATPFSVFCVYTSSQLCEVRDNQEFSSISQLGLQFMDAAHQLPPLLQNGLVISMILFFTFVSWILLMMNPWVVGTLLSVVGIIHYNHCTKTNNSRIIH